METQGLITKIETSVGGRGKSIYQITENGRRLLGDWLKAEQVHNELRYETLLKFFFGGAGGRDVSIHNIEVFEEQIRKDLIVYYSLEGNTLILYPKYKVDNYSF